MSKQLVETKKQQVSGFMLNPANLTEAMQLAEMLAKSQSIPKHFWAKPADVLIVINRGMELGFSPLQALDAFSIINGKLCMGGDHALALVQASSSYEYHKSEFIRDDTGGNHYCQFTIKRRNNEEHVVTFSIEDAKKARLWGKDGPWTQYPKRMLNYRALSFALRDKFSDVLKGVGIKEEVMDYEEIQLSNGTSIAQEKLKNTKGSRADILADIINPVNTPQDVNLTDADFKEESIYEDNIEAEFYDDLLENPEETDN